MDFSLLAQAVPPTTQVPTEWWVPLIAAILVALWDIVKRKFNLVEPINPLPEPAPPVVVPPAPVTPAPVQPSPTPILDIIAQLLPALIPAITLAVKDALKQEPK